MAVVRKQRELITKREKKVLRPATIRLTGFILQVV
jgi:hypothetical protein